MVNVKVYCTKVLYQVYAVSEDGTTYSHLPTGVWVKSSSNLSVDEIASMVFINEATIRVWVS